MRINNFLLSLAVLVASLAGVHGQERYETLEVGPVVYEDVEVLSKTATDLFITHSKGACNIKVSNLDDELKLALGYDLSDFDSNADFGPMPLKSVSVDPRVAEINAKLAAEVEQFLKQVAPGLVLGVLAGMVVLYLFFCYCCSLICKKAGSEPSFLIWVPVLQVFPLFRAAGMSGWSVLGMFAPHLFLAVAAVKLPAELTPHTMSGMIFLGLGIISMLIPLIISLVFSVKICIARGKSGWLGVLFLLPLTNLFVFLYLAFSGTGHDPEPANPGFVTFN